jgi:predicted DNA-binding transcriptional regulator YafY
MMLLGEGNVLTSQCLARKLGVSTRTVYRDIGDLVNSGVPIEGESGVGFLLRDDHRLPSLSFTNNELRALALGAQMVRVWPDRELGIAGEAALRKIETALPGRSKAKTQFRVADWYGAPMPEGDPEKLSTASTSLDPVGPT